MSNQETPVKRPTITRVVEKPSSFIKRPTDGYKKRLSAPIRDDPENRIAPLEITGAPKALRCRREPQLDVVSPTGLTLEDKNQATPRRRSTHLQVVQRTPRAPARRHSIGTPMDASTPKQRKVIGCMAPLRPHRVETRKILRDSVIFRNPFTVF